MPHKRVSDKLGSRSRIHVGLTGSLASGKTSALREFKRGGWQVLSADEMVHEIYEEQNVDREALRRGVLSSKRALKRLEAWIHPLVEKKMRQFLKRECRAVVEIPLLFEAGFEEYFDWLVYVYAPKQERRRRAIKRGMPGKIFDFLEGQQWPAVKKTKRADFVLHNREPASLKAQIKRLKDFFQP